MNEFLRSFIMQGIRDMVKHDVALYQTYQYASGWFSKDVLKQEDLEEIARLYAEKEAQTIEEAETTEADIAEEISAETAEETEENTKEEGVDE